MVTHKEKVLNQEIQIGGRVVGPSHPPMIVAEILGNHGGSLERAIQLVEEASQTGAHTIKFQTFTPDTITLELREKEFLIQNNSDPRFPGKSLFELYKEAMIPWEWLPKKK